MNNRKGLNWRQVRYINLILLAKCTTEQVMASLKMRPSTLIKWMEKEAFKKEWTAALGVLDMLRRTDEQIFGINDARHQRHMARSLGQEHAGECETPPLETDPPGYKPSAPPEREGTRNHDDREKEELSERERVRARNGEEAAQAYDRLMRLHELHRQGQQALEAAEPSEEDESAKVDESPTETKPIEAREKAAETSPIAANSDDTGEPPANISPPGPASANGGEFKRTGELGS